MATTQAKDELANKPAVETAPQLKNISESVILRIKELSNGQGLVIPKDYSPENAIRSAWLMLQDQKDKDNKPVLESCTRESIANALMKMVVEGLSVLKHQGSFIPYGGKLSWNREYAGNIALAKRYGNLKDIKANAIFEGDDFAFEIDTNTGRRKIIKHTQTLDSVGNLKLRGAYAILEYNDGSKDIEIMNIAQIQKAWEQSPMKGNSPAHKNFPDQMACKTVINRACKIIINSSSDANIISGSDELNNEIEENVAHKSNVAEETKTTITQNANVETVSFEEVKDANNETNPGEQTNGAPADLFETK